MGLLFGFVCYGFASSEPNTIPVSLAISIILSRTLIGFAIGISNLKFSHWAWHGVVIGFIFSLPMGFGAITVKNFVFTPGIMFASTLIFGVIYGFLIELFTTVVFKAKQEFPKNRIL